MTETYKQAFTEVLEILSYLSKDNYNKISKELINAIESNRDIDYLYYIDTTKSLEEQEMLEETRAILFNIYRDYLADNNTKQQILNYQNQENIVKEQIKSQNIKINDMFTQKSKTNGDELKDISYENVALIEVKPKTNIFNKIINKIKSLFKMK